MQERFAARVKMIGAVCFFHFVPWTALALYTGWMLAPAERWTFLSIALCSVLLATLLLIACMRQFENTLEAVFSDPNMGLIYSRGDQESGSEENTLEAPYVLLYEETLQQLKQEQNASKELKELIERERQYNAELESASQAEKTALHAELEEERQRAENCQKQIIYLETAARDLKYEIKSLVDSTDCSARTSLDPKCDFDSISSFVSKPLNVFLEPVSTLSSAESQLKLCVDVAQKFTGARHLTSSHLRFQDPSIEGYDLDLRRLTDTLLSVSERPILLYHQSQRKLLFLSPQIKKWLGWGTEKYFQDFSALFPEGQEVWDEALRQLPLLGTLEISKTLSTSVGEPFPAVFHLAWVPAGIFKSHVIGVMDQAPQFVS